MKEAGILSMQRIANYGSFLQAYGLKSMLEELGCRVQFVDYHPGKTLLCPDKGTGLTRKIGKVAEILRSRAPLKAKLQFILYKKNFSGRNDPYLQISKEKNYAPELDVLIIGSDEVFNCVQDNTNVGFSPELFGEGNRAKKLVSYAASFGNTTREKLEKYQVADKVKNWLLRFDQLSVRDANSAQITEELTGKKPQIHLDPVLMYDFIGRCKEIPQKISAKKYMILYGYTGRFSKEECRTIREYAKEKKLQVCCIGGIQNVCDRFIDCNPFEVIAYFQHADCVVTDTFHGTILSVIAKRPFLSVVRESGYGNAEKMNDLLKRLKLEERKGDLTENISGLMEKPIDYLEIEEILEKERKRTVDYLTGSLEDI